jgi:RHS repeat-associated protein
MLAHAQEVIFDDGFENRDPVIISSPPTTASLGNLYSYDVDAEDPDGDTLLYLLTTSPEGMTIDPVSGLIQWTPDILGTYPVTVDVSDGQRGSATQAWDIEVLEIVDSDGDGLSDDDEAIAGTDPNDPDSDDDGVLDGAEVFTHGTDPLDPDTDKDNFFDGSELAVGTDPLDPNDFPDVPPDPKEVAPDPDSSVAGNVRDTTEFLYTGEDPIQQGVAPETIELNRAALLRGKVMTRLGAPLPGVTITILGHPEFGNTRSRADGMFDLAVNGGGALTIDYQLDGYLPSQRTVNAGWQEYVIAPDVAMIPVDPVMTPIDLDAPGEMKVARGSMQSDDDGERQATILFPAGVSAQLRMPDGSMLPISSLGVRATEYTVGEMGEMAMPGDLPPTSGYTYAVELSVDEAMAMGATSVEFDRPLPFYVENFLGFPAGSPVPAGYYDRNLASWITAPSGLVIDIISETSGLADLDVDGDGQLDHGTALTALGITDAERQQLADLYGPGQSIWRIPVDHFTPFDFNWPFGPPGDATYPERPRPTGETIEYGICEARSSIIECQNQVLGERVSPIGTPFTLNYRSSRTPGQVAARSIDISLTGPSIPASLKRVKLEVSVAGQSHEFSLAPSTGMTQVFSWDGRNAFGQIVQGGAPAVVRIGYVYDGVYRTSAGLIFAQTGELPIEGSLTRGEITLPQQYTVRLGAWDARGHGLGGWTLSAHHAYDPANRTLYRGDGSRRQAERISDVIVNKAGKVNDQGWAEGCYSSSDVEAGCGDGLPATEAKLSDPEGIAFMSDGSLLIAEVHLNRVRRVRPDGVIENFAGSGDRHFGSEDNGDGGPAVDAKIDLPVALAVGPRGAVYIIERDTQTIRKVDPMGIISTYAGGEEDGANLSLYRPSDVEVDGSGNVFILDYCRIVRVDPLGQWSVIAGKFAFCTNSSGDGGPATLATFRGKGLALGPDGSIYLTDFEDYRIRRIDKDGTIDTIAGNGINGYGGDGGPALSASFGNIFDITVARDGSIYVPDRENNRLRRVRPDGIVETVAGGDDGESESSGLYGPAVGAYAPCPHAATLGPDGQVYFSSCAALVYQLKSPFSGLGAGEFLISAKDGLEVYKFDASGRHLQTQHALTSAAVLEFGYDIEGRLETVTDGDGKITTIQRDGFGNPTAIISPFGQMTALAVDATGFLETITNPAGESLQIQSSVDGLILETTDPRGRISSYGYSDLGRLTSQSDNGGQNQAFARSATPGSFDVTRTTTLGRAVNYDVQQIPGTAQSNTNTAPDGSQTSAQFNNLTGVTSATSATGMTSTFREKADPRFGMQSPILQTAEVSAPGGPTMTVSSSSEVNLSDAGDPFSLITLSGTSTVSNRTTISTYTAANKTLVQTTPEGRTSIVEIDNQGRIVRSQFGDLAPVISQYNNLGQLTTLTHGSGDFARVTTFVYGPDGFWDSITDPLGRTTTYTRDLAGRISTKSLPGDVDILFGYNAAGELDSIAPPGQPEHGFIHNLYGQITQYDPPAVTGGGPTTYTYNADRQILSRALPDDQLVSYAYDNEGRLASVELREGGLLTASYVMSYGIANRLDSVEGPGAQQIDFGYQGDLVTSETWSGLVEGAVSWTHDDAFRVASETVSGGATVNIGYDNDDLLTSLGAFSITRSASNGLAQSATLGVLVDSWTHNEFGEVTAYTVSVNASAVYDVSYSLDDLGRITQKVETIGGVTTTYDYDYDLRGQLTEVQANSVVVESYSYDDNGNRLSATVDGVTSDGSHDAQDRLTAYGDDNYDHSGAGRRTTRTGPGNLVTTYDYDPLGNLRSVTLPDATVVEYLHDGSDRRVQRSVGGTISHRLIYDGPLPLAELNELGNVVSQFVYAGGNVPVYLIKGGVNYRLISDQVGSVRLVVNAQTGAIVQRLDYDSFGNVLLDTNPGFQPFGFAGGLYDPLTGLVQFGTRDYDPQTGRWTVKDLIGFGGADTNLYRYANNNPVNIADPTGTGFWSGLLGFVGGVGDGLMKAVNPTLAAQSAAESLSAVIEDWLGINNDWRGPNPGSMFPPPPGVDQSDYLDGHLFGECTVDIASLGAGGGISAWRNLPRLGSALSGRLGRFADKLRNIPNLLKGAGQGLKPLWDEAYRFGQKWGKKALDQVYSPGIPNGEQKLLKGTHSKFDKAKSKPGRF